jgi:hypothetical protein
LDKKFYEDFKESYYKKFKRDSFKDNIVKIVKSKTADEILKISERYTKIDFLNIDVEGMDLKILKQIFPHKLKPKLISIETHNPDNIKLRDCDQIYNYLTNNNYVVFKRAGPSTLFSIN